MKRSHGARPAGRPPGPDARRGGADPTSEPSHATARTVAAAELPAWAALCFFVSGAAGLLYELVWSKELSLLLGNSLHAISTVVAAFLCGLALGAWRLGRALARPDPAGAPPGARGARRYAGLELGIAVLGLLSVPALHALDPLIAFLERAFGIGTPIFAFARFVLVFLSLLPPTLLMGATLPVLVEHFEHALVGPALARLYAINTIGAVAGSWLGGFALVPNLGLRATTWVAAGLNLVAALLALAFAREPAEGIPTQPRGGTPGRAAADAAGAVLPARARRTVAVALALSGFAALAFQIAWVRLFGLLLGSSVYSFAGVLGVYLAGLAIGSALAGRLLARLNSLAAVAAMQAGIAFTAAAAIGFFPLLPDAYLTLVQRAGTHWTSLFFSQLTLVAAVLLLPCVLFGAIFPLATRLLSAADGGRGVGRAYAVNTLGTIAGSLAAGYVLVPRLGVQGTHVAALALSAIVALLLLVESARLRERQRSFGTVALVALVLAGAGVAFAPTWNPILMSVGVFRPSARVYVESAAAGSHGSLVRAAIGREKLLLYREGLNGSVLVTRDTLANNTILRINGKVDASDSDMLTQVLSGLVPGALADSGARTFVIGQGSGITLGAVLAAGAGETDLAEIERAVIDGSHFFQAPGHDPLDDPRVHVFLEDGRVVLSHTRTRYGLIVSEPPNPWLAGVNNLFTLDFYRLVRKRLEPGGVFAQWIQLYEISPETFRSILAAFLQVFPHGQAFIASSRADLVLVASDRARTLSLARLRAPQVKAELARAKLLGPEAVAAFWIAPFESLRTLADHPVLNRDDRPIVEYRAPRDLIAMSRTVQGGPPPLVALLPHGHWPDARVMFAAWSEESWFDARARQLARSGYFDPARDVAADARAAGLASLADRLRASVDAEQVGQALGVLVGRAHEAAEGGRSGDARELLSQATLLAPRNGRVWVLLADQQRELGAPDSALVSLARAVAVGTTEERRDARLMAGLIEIQRGHLAAAVGHFTAARTLDPRNALAWAFEARARLDAGDRAGAEAAVRRGLVVAPGDAQLLSVEQALGTK
ncbi:MAG TPA: fused MFS/spermidine synthase [Candidatus Acidoferrales bacterium]|nr:fused MFS/spermidine synthase [Candidatus Acidoferrales bacterium]